MATMRACCSDASLDPCGSDTCVMARAVLRYVPAGDVTGMDALVTARVVETVGGLPVIELGPRIGFVAPDSARRIAHALHAAADAAEEMTR